MLQGGSARHCAHFLGALALLALAAPTTPASVFDALPHLKRPPKPVASQYGPCYGHFQTTYRQWPGECLINPVQPRRPNPYSMPGPAVMPEEPPADPGEPVSGILFEVQPEPTLIVPVSARSQPAKQPPFHTDGRR